MKKLKKNYNEILKYLKENPEINLNIQDETQNYFVEYVLDSNNMELIKFVYLEIFI